jgi:hypothetical protein
MRNHPTPHTAHHLRANTQEGMLLLPPNQAKSHLRQMHPRPAPATSSPRHSRPNLQPDHLPTNRIRTPYSTATCSTRTTASKPHRTASENNHHTTTNQPPQPQAQQPALKDNPGTTLQAPRPRSPRPNSAATSSRQLHHQSHALKNNTNRNTYHNPSRPASQSSHPPNQATTNQPA